MRADERRPTERPLVEQPLVERRLAEHLGPRAARDVTAWASGLETSGDAARGRRAMIRVVIGCAIALGAVQVASAAVIVWAALR